MPEEDAIAADLRHGLHAFQPKQIMATFNALAFLDGTRILQRAMQTLEHCDLEALVAVAGGDAQLTHDLTMEVFRDSVLGYCEGKGLEVEEAVEHDIPTWLEAYAPLFATANLKHMDAALVEDEPDPALAQRSLIEYHQRIDVAACEDRQARVLLSAWESVETLIGFLVTDVSAARS
ncbi:hypothetical protein F2Q65_17310 [Thiohalocapsa marina]|uniref:Uncharacterized protein n=1 Tax=Thiohalocapsa marina TaxID=424902 RepID=A0A5M8FHZ7_9GAMM|nr:hypothetical protein [Thiohalocapsa marina]KAA6182731.1 hypothetical protein F2Q65_17310 [Thiohalocapsa marina]